MVGSLLQQRRKALELHHKRFNHHQQGEKSPIRDKVDDVLISFSLTSNASYDSTGTHGSDTAVMHSSSFPDIMQMPITNTNQAVSTPSSSECSSLSSRREDHSATHFIEHPALLAKSCQRSIHPAANKQNRSSKATSVALPTTPPRRQTTTTKLTLLQDYFTEEDEDVTDTKFHQVSKQRYKLATSNAKKRLKAKHQKPVGLPSIPLPPSHHPRSQQDNDSNKVNISPRTLDKARNLAASGCFRSRRIAVTKKTSQNETDRRKIICDNMPPSMSNNNDSHHHHDAPTTATDSLGSVIEDFATHCSFSPSGISDLSVSSDEQEESHLPSGGNVNAPRRSRPRLPTTGHGTRGTSKSPTNNTTNSLFTPITTTSRDSSISPPPPPPPSDATVNSKHLQNQTLLRTARKRLGKNFCSTLYQTRYNHHSPPPLVVKKNEELENKNVQLEEEKQHLQHELISLKNQIKLENESVLLKREIEKLRMQLELEEEHRQLYQAMESLKDQISICEASAATEEEATNGSRKRTTSPTSSSTSVDSSSSSVENKNKSTSISSKKAEIQQKEDKCNILTSSRIRRFRSTQRSRPTFRPKVSN